MKRRAFIKSTAIMVAAAGASNALKAAQRLQPEALYKAARCFDKLNQSGRADTMRTELKRTYANSPWANK